MSKGDIEIYNLKKELLEELKTLRKLEKKQLKLIDALDDNMDIYRIYDEEVLVENDISVSNTDHITIRLPQLLSRKKQEHLRLLYEDTLLRALIRFKEESDIKSIDKSLIIFEHMAPDIVEKGLRDNDNYSSDDAKQIVDCLVRSGILKSDRGDKCFMLHMTSLTEKKAHTVIHVLDTKENYITILENLIKQNPTE